MIRQRIRATVFGVFAILLLPVLALVLAAGTRQTAVKTKARVAPAEDAPPNKSLGSHAAPITIEVFSDYQCPACRVLYKETLRPLMDDYVATGKVFLVHRDFPLPMHRYSQVAARLVNAAAKIGKFEKAEEALYSKQDSWEKDGNLDAALATVLTPAELKRVKQIAESGRMDAFIESDVALGKSKQINQTPSLFVTHNGQTDALPPGGVTYTLLKRYLDSFGEK